MDTIKIRILKNVRTDFLFGISSGCRLQSPARYSGEAWNTRPCQIKMVQSPAFARMGNIWGLNQGSLNLWKLLNGC